jgi:hypothetical protein
MLEGTAIVNIRGRPRITMAALNHSRAKDSPSSCPSSSRLFPPILLTLFTSKVRKHHLESSTLATISFFHGKLNIGFNNGSKQEKKELLILPEHTRERNHNIDNFINLVLLAVRAALAHRSATIPRILPIRVHIWKR